MDQEAFEEAMIQWVGENAYRFVRPEREYWPDEINSRIQANEYYGKRAADEIIEYMERE